MKRTRTIIFFALLVTLLLAGSAALEIQTAWSQSAGRYDLSWWTVDGGGGESGGGGYTLRGTAGQHDAGTLSGSGYTLTAGFWGGTSPMLTDDEKVYLPIVVR